MVCALIAEDEPLLAQALSSQLRELWPQVRLLPPACNGQEALTMGLREQPDVVFLDIQMPVMTGMDVAAALVEEWGADKPVPLIVFVTAYDQYAIEAFENAAIDYVLKPVRPERLHQALVRVQERLAQRAQVTNNESADWSRLQAALQEIQGAVQHAEGVERLKTIQASNRTHEGSVIAMVPIEAVVYFEAADKYVRVLTNAHEYLIRTPIKDLLPQLDADVFWQVHRSTIVRVGEISQVVRDEMGKVHIKLKSRPERLGVSRLYAHLFRAM